MENWKEVNEKLGAELGDKYSYTSANGGIYYQWNNSNDRKLNKPDLTGTDTLTYRNRLIIKVHIDQPEKLKRFNSPVQRNTE
jgi:hypothetical protein